ncbi:peptide/nickel transport system ATP-binding protein [Glaciihabitans tibetensis]|uniref:Peptide/nickel transport system ATP-binding protein n=1 Tax=Glaciihabitans tibetensis TaxID=1266600 RepID=A0A2T0VFI2_9MICO|nr:ABC transporter ATP-binding protein [Glaciihabitans tibetensis]PRY68970.1 peptide/nickel transport system ATP-binding protein [Glaciihabitans tibetensis]
MTLLSVSSLGVTAPGGRALVSDLSFDLAAGKRLGLIGESGSGKSVTSLAVTGLLGAGLVATGSVLLDGVQVVGGAERRLVPLRGRVASVVFQEPLTALDPLMRIGKQLAEPLARHRALRGAALRVAVSEALAEVSLDDARIARAYPHEISGGQRQRAAIAIALSSRPQLLIADEPTTALDVTVQAQIVSLLDNLVEARGMALLFISHDLAVVSAMTNDLIVMSAGVAVERGTVAEVLSAPKDPYTAQLVRSARDLDAMLGER